MQEQDAVSICSSINLCTHMHTHNATCVCVWDPKQDFVTPLDFLFPLGFRALVLDSYKERLDVDSALVREWDQCLHLC